MQQLLIEWLDFTDSLFKCGIVYIVVLDSNHYAGLSFQQGFDCRKLITLASTRSNVDGSLAAGGQLRLL
ncbi:MAG: hypothetical protein R2792_04425 [Saprospiraceae bacterium]